MYTTAKLCAIVHYEHDVLCTDLCPLSAVVLCTNKLCTVVQFVRYSALPSHHLDICQFFFSMCHVIYEPVFLLNSFDLIYPPYSTLQL